MSGSWPDPLDKLAVELGPGPDCDVLATFDALLGAVDPAAGSSVGPFVTIQKGCDHKCTFCIVPTTRGPELSRPSGEILDEGQAGDNVGLLLRGMKKEDVERGMVICKPGSVTPHTKFEGEVYILTKEEGGRHTPFFTGYRPQFYFRTTDVTGSAELPEGREMVMPGDNVTMDITLITPIAMEEGLRFAIREGGRTVGAGVVAKILE